ncbi:TlpA disulfide reductase family protein [Dyella jiangningensis]|jgi:thiol-disulfide isomerase/thioredoxin|uniref:TlpA family protein disulfide reductase n=1 Tax=Dyella jiangningensis TaxID=1379159 RepID=UPI00240ECF28|nr:TlpA disulfide reductase family protein [Dyella jiangningensis]MDG2536084.1 TlpA disulfide reductase family protein [Dyella jiangningensis]
MKRIVQLALAMLALTLVTVCLARPGPGDVPPDYLGRDRNGHDLHVSDLRGKVVIVTFWATWCGYCMKELPVLAALQKMKGSNDLAVVGVSHNDDLEAFKKARHNWRSLDVILTYDAKDHLISKPYGVNTIPHMVIIGRDGRIDDVYVGYDESMLDQILAEVDELLKQPAPQAPAAAAP